MLVRSRVVLPISKPPIPDGAVEIADGRIVWVGRWSERRNRTARRGQDLGGHILLPGLVNAHCHLDYTGFAGQIPSPRSFTDWIKSIIALKSGWSYTEFAESWVRGAGMLLDSGVTSVADIEAVPELLPDILPSKALRVFSFREILTIRSRAIPEVLVEKAAKEWSDALAEADGGGLSPHSPYATTGDVVTCCVRAARKRGWRWTMHLAESSEEMEMFSHARGPLHHWLKDQRESDDCGKGSPVQYLERLGVLGEDLIAVHVNYLAEGDAEILGRHRVHVVHCPRSHDYFGHEPFPLGALAAAGVNICLGTDSLATTRQDGRRAPRLSLFREMQGVAAQFSGLPAEEVLRMATSHGARALGMEGQLGVLEPNANADMIAIPYEGEVGGACEAVVGFGGRVPIAMIGGRWVREPGAKGV